MNGLTALAAGVLIVATYISSLVFSLHRRRRAALARRLEERGTPEAADWLAENRKALVAFLLLMLTTLRVTFIATVIALFADAEAGWVIDVGSLFAAGGISVGLIWLFTSIIPHAIAEHAGVGTLIHSMGVLRVANGIARPLWRIPAVLDEAVRRLSGANLHNSAAEDELLRSIEETHLEGALDPESAEMLENVVELRTTDVGEIMTPRTDIEGIERTDDLMDIRAFIAKAGHSRIPVFEGNLDTILGILYVKDLVPFLGEDGSDFKLESLLRRPIRVPETKPVRELLADFQQAEIHLAIVVDEYGGTAGLVTIEDALEEIVGEIHDEHEPDDEVEPTIVTAGDGRTVVDGRYHIDDLNEFLGLELPEEEEYDTVAGYVLAELGRVPKCGEAFESHGARFTVEEATETQVEKIAIERLALEEGASPTENGRAGG